MLSALLAKEVSQGFMIGPFASPPFPVYRVSPIGVATRKYSGKQRLVIDLSAPRRGPVPSINGLIPSPDYSLAYTTIDHAISLICGAWVAKADITTSFKVLPIHPDYWAYFGVCWEDSYYFSVRLAFSCKSSPRLFDCLSEALSWILLNESKVPFLVHLLDDFLPPPAQGLHALTTVFSQLGVPLSLEKTEGPATTLEFLGITLDSVAFKASLPTDKLDRITLLLSNYLITPTCTKRQLLSLLGHLNYALRIIPQGRSFISHLLLLASSVQLLHHTITLKASCLMELELWHHLLSHWNSITFFYNDLVSNPNDM